VEEPGVGLGFFFLFSALLLAHITHYNTSYHIMTGAFWESGLGFLQCVFRWLGGWWVMRENGRTGWMVEELQDTREAGLAW
jgi:cytochrome bd-type quinol oxidase subunit 1